MRRTLRSIRLLPPALLLATAAAGQNYVVQSASVPYQPVVGGTSLLSMFGSTADDRGITLPIGFSFPYYGSTYNQILLSSNGFASFITSQCSGGCNDGQSIPRVTRNSGVPHLIIAPWWDDHAFNVGGNTTTDVRYTSTATQLEVEWKDVNAYSFSGFVYQFTVKMTLFATGQIQVHYGPHSGSGGTAVAGFENGDGTLGESLPMLPLPLTACSATAANCTMANFPTDTLYTIGQPVQPDLVVQSVTLNSVTNNAGMLTVSVSPTFRNFGQNAANGFVWKAYLSTDRLYQPADTLLVTATTSLNCAGGSTVVGTASGSIPTPANGNYFVLIEVDSSNAVAEGTFGEGNNYGATANHFVSGLDLVATSVSGPATSGPGNSMTVHVNWFNQGTDAAGTVGFGIYLSTDNTFSANDFELYSGTKTISGGQTVDEDVTFTVPQTVPGGDFFYILRVNTGTPPVVEAPGNNAVASSAKVNVRQADLVIRSVEFVDVATGTPTRAGLFGAQGRVLVTAANEGGADARNFKVGIVISVDSNLSLLQDTIVIEAPVALVAQGTTQVIDVMFPVPLNDRNNRAFTTGNYFWFGLLDSAGQVTELNEFNNNLVVSSPVLMSSPAPDLTVTRFDAPSTVGVGEVAPVYRVFKNIGNRDASDVKYRYYLSANAQVTVDDIPLMIQSSGSSIPQRTVTLPAPPAANIDVATELVEIPGNVTPGTYYLGAVLDFDRAIVELDEANNGLASMPVTVAASSLRVTTPGLPDAVVGRPYSFQLSAAGEAPGQPTTWAVDAAQGQLPQGMTLSASGLLSGAPTQEVVVGVTVVVTNAGRSAQARLALRVLPTTTQVEITTPSLPSVVNSPTVPYETFLGAAGGVKPYRWSIFAVSGEVLPRNLALTPEGRLYGNPAAGIMEKEYPLTVEVRDTLGTAARRSFTLRVVAPGAIVFTNLNIPDGLVGATYVTDIAVRNFDGSPLAKPVQFDVIAGALPDGIVKDTQGEVALLQGTPRVAGTYPFTLQVSDAKGRKDSADFVMRVYASGLTVLAKDLPDRFRPGDPVDFHFEAAGTGSVTFSLFSGALPPGAMLGSDGRVVGMIATEQSEGTYNFVIEARDGSSATGIGAFTTTVRRDIPKQGCRCDVQPLGALGMAAAAALLRRRKK